MAEVSFDSLEGTNGAGEISGSAQDSEATAQDSAAPVEPEASANPAPATSSSSSVTPVPKSENWCFFSITSLFFPDPPAPVPAPPPAETEEEIAARLAAEAAVEAEAQARALAETEAAANEEAAAAAAAAAAATPPPPPPPPALIAPRVRGPPKNLNEDFVGLANLVQEHKQQVAQFVDWAAAHEWGKFHTGNYEYWAFPLNEKSKKGFTYAVYAEEIDELKRDVEFMRRFRDGLRLVAQSWGE